jgi:hypothetical protein
MPPKFSSNSAEKIVESCRNSSIQLLLPAGEVVPPPGGQGRSSTSYPATPDSSTGRQRTVERNGRQSESGETERPRIPAASAPTRLLSTVSSGKQRRRRQRGGVGIGGEGERCWEGFGRTDWARKAARLRA